MDEICKGDNCFYCGASRDKALFNDEHILPNWILRKFNLHARKITLPNGAKVTYGTYKVPCCETCNRNLGELVENPVREFLSLGYDQLKSGLTSEKLGLVYIWLSLIYFKIHYKGIFLRENPAEPNSPKMAENYDWSELHHVHCIARIPYSCALVDSECLATIFILKAKCEEYYEHFDFFDLHPLNTIYMRLGDVAIFAVLNDANCSFNFMFNVLNDITDPLTPIQLREVLVHLSFINESLPQRPNFISVIENGQYKILAEKPVLPEKIIKTGHQERFGELLHYTLKDLISRSPDLSKEEVEKKVKAGEMTFLRDDDGKFIKNSYMPNNLAD
jgi:hypothetical protein